MSQPKTLFKLTLLVSAITLLAIAPSAIPRANAYGNLAVWQIGLSANCNNPDFCTPFQGGFWGWVEWDSDGTGDAAFAGCGHLVAAGPVHMAGADSIRADLTGWYINPTTHTFWATGGEVTFAGASTRGQPVTFSFADSGLSPDSGIPGAAGHYSAAQLFGMRPPPGVAFELQVVRIPNR